MKQQIERVRGTRDFYPEEKRIQNYIFEVWKSAALKFGFEEMDGPLLEPVELWHEKSGSEIEEQMYVLTDRGGRRLAVRPEMTPTLGRMVAQRYKELTKPIKWFSIQRFWRYEKPQSGRLREFWQLNIDTLGTESMKADSEIIASAVWIMRSFGLAKDDFVVGINNRRLLSSLLRNAGVDAEKVKDACRILDKRDKLSPSDFRQMLSDSGISSSAVQKILNFESLKIEDISQMDLDEEGKKGLSELKELLSYLSAYGISEYCKFDLTLARGLDYYTGTVFEVFDTSKEFRAIAGGGRYDNLVSQFGGDKCPGVGYAMGDVVLELFLRRKGKLPELNREIDFFVACTSDSLYFKAVEIAQRLRQRNYSVAVDVMERSLSKQLKYANTIGVRRLLIVGEDELLKGAVKLKDMNSGSESILPLSSLDSI
ncbi:MAG: histidine--tRNA ligase [Candidatus Woesearchaeota archaeon]